MSRNLNIVKKKRVGSRESGEERKLEQYARRYDLWKKGMESKFLVVE